MIRRPPRSTQSRSSAASDVYKRQIFLYTNVLRYSEMLTIGTPRVYAGDIRCTINIWGKMRGNASECFLYPSSILKSKRIIPPTAHPTWPVLQNHSNLQLRFPVSYTHLRAH